MNHLIETIQSGNRFAQYVEVKSENAKLKVTSPSQEIRVGFSLGSFYVGEIRRASFKRHNASR